MFVFELQSIANLDPANPLVLQLCDELQGRKQRIAT